jgi:KaiC/GvpD/RAD55 family RecA-like ATPase
MTSVIPVDIEGLNLILGGGIPVLERQRGSGESATLLLRGPPGSGKTIFATQLAGSLARTLGGDVAYGCVELLPSELAAQHAGIKRPEIKERVVMAPFHKREPDGDDCRIFAEMLDIGSPGEEVAKLGDAIEHLLKVIERVGGRPRVLVIDSLSDGYRLGASAPRELADALCKMAASKGMILILLEEILESTPSAWSFATDVVLQLGPSEGPAAGASESFERRLTVAKNRFGPSEQGAQRFAILPAFGVRVLPHSRAYLSKWASRVVLADWRNNLPREQGWPMNMKLPQGWPSFQMCVTAIHGVEGTDVRREADRLGATTTDGQPLAGSDIFLDFSRDDAPIDPSDMKPGELLKIGCGEPYLSGDWLLSTVLTSIDELRLRRQPIRRILAGDLQSLRSFGDPEGIRHALGVLIAILRRVKIPAILFETAARRTGLNPDLTWYVNDAFAPRLVDFADVVIERVRAADHRTWRAIVSHARSGQQVLI